MTRNYFFRLKAVAIFCYCFASGVSWGQTVLYTQDFETDLSGYSHTPSQLPSADPGDRYFHRADPSDSDIYEGSVGPYTNVTNSFLFVGSNPNTINSSNPGILTLDGITVTDFTDLEFNADFGSVPSDWDTPDELSVEYNFDGGAWNTLFSFSSSATNTPLALTGNATGGSNTANGVTLTYALQTITSDNFTGSGTILNIRIVCDSDANYEAFGVDNIVVRGTSTSTSTLTAGAGTEPSSISSLVNTSGAASTNFDFTFNENDASNVDINGITFTQGTGNGIADWSQAIESAELSDGLNTLTVSSVTATSLVFSSIPTGAGQLGRVSASSTKTYQLKVWLKNPLEANFDNDDFVFEVNSNSFTFTAGGVATSQSVNSGDANNNIIVTATELNLSGLLSTVQVGGDFNLTVAATDANGNLDEDDATSITLARNAGTGILSSVTGLTQSLSSGTFSWTDLQYDTEETFSIDVSGSGFTTVTSGSITADSDPRIAITEFVNDPSTHEWLEIYNYGTTPVDLQNWRVKDADSDDDVITTSSLILNAGEFAIITKNKTSFESNWLGGTPNSNVIEVSSLVLANSADEIILEDASSNVIWRVDYTSDGTTGRATFITEAPSETNTTWVIVRDGTDTSPSSLGYEGNNRTTDLLAFTGTDNGATASPLLASFNFVIWNGTVWSNGTGPTASDDAILQGNYNTSTNGSFSCKDLAVNASTTLTIADGTSVTVAGDLGNLGTISIAHTGAFVQTATSPTNTGAGTYTVNKTGDDYRGVYNYWSSPVMDETIGDALPIATANNRYFFDASVQNWSHISNESTALTPGVGYIATGRSNPPGSITRTFSSTTGFNSGDLTLNLTFNSDADTDNDWNLIGNPYPSGISVASFLTDANNDDIDNAVYLWNSDGNDYTVTDAEYTTITEGGVISGGGDTNPTMAVVSSGQGFFVRTLNSSPTITFANSHRSTTNNTFLRTKRQDEWQRLWLGVRLDQTYSNETLIGFMPDASEGRGRYDATKLKGNPHIALYSLLKDEHLVAQGLPSLTADRVVPIGLDANQVGNYTFKINRLDQFPDDYDIIFYDATTQSFTNLRTDNYSVSLEKGHYTQRFSIRFIKNSVLDLPDLEEPETIQVYSSTNTIHLSAQNIGQASVSIFDLSGKSITTPINLFSNQTLSIPTRQSGIFIVRILTNNGTMTRKLFVD